jgi:biotin transporter BioY
LVLAPLFAAIGLLLGALVLDLFSGTRRIGLSVRLNDWAGAWLFFPPVALVGGWLWSRGRRSTATTIQTE